MPKGIGYNKNIIETLRKSFGMQRETLIRVLGLEKKIEELQAAKQKVEEDTVDVVGDGKIEGIVDVIGDAPQEIVEDKVEEAVEDKVEEAVETKVDDKVEARLQALEKGIEEIEDKIEEAVEDKVEEAVDVIGDGKIDDIVDVIGDAPQDFIEDKVEDKVEEAVDVIGDGKIDDIVDVIGDAPQDFIEDKVEDKVEDIEEKVDDKIESRLEALEEVVEDKVEEIEDKTPDKSQNPDISGIFDDDDKEEIPPELDDLIKDVRGEKEEGGTETKKSVATKKKTRKIPVARKIPKKKPVVKKKKISAESLKKGTVLDDDFKSRVYGIDEEGEPLSGEERKIRFKKSKISADDIRGTKPVDTPPEPTSKDEGETEGLKGIRDVLDDILKVLRLDFKGDRKEARDAQKEAARKKRGKREDELEGRGGGIGKAAAGIGKAVKAMVSPFSSIWDNIINFIKTVFIGALFNKTMKWFGDPKNQKKAERIGKFFKDWWPALALAAGLFLTPLGGLVSGVVGLLTAIIPKLVMAIASNPYAALALVGTGLAVWGITSLSKGLGGDKEGENLAEAQNQSSTQLQDEGMGAGDAEVLSQSVTTSNVNKMTEGDTNIRSNTNMLQTGMNDPLGGNSMGRFNFNEGGLVQHYNDQKSAQNFVQRYNEGGLVQNFNEGGMVDKELVYSLKKFKTEKVVKGGEIERTKTREKTQGSIKLEDLYEHQEQILSQLPQGTTIESIVNGTSGIDAEVLYPILQNSDAQAVSNAKERAVNMQFLQDNNLINSDNSVKGYSSFNQNFKGGGLVNNYQNFKGGGLVETYNNLTKIKNYKQGGFVSGPGGVDKVPARLTAGEFVMSKGAVQKFGVNTLASMNAAGGGTNVPTITQEYNQGGLVQYFESGGIVRDMAKEPVGTPIVNSTNKTITLPTIPKQDQSMTRSNSDVPQFRIPIQSSQRSMVISSLGISDLIGG